MTETPAENWRKRWDARNPPLSWAAIAAPKFPPCGQIPHHPASRTQSPRFQLKKLDWTKSNYSMRINAIESCNFTSFVK
jgi:hypothetical protein